MLEVLKINKCNIAHMFGELRRFALHLTLIHIISILINGKSVYDDKFFLILITTLISIASYHIFIRKSVEPDEKKMKKICKEHDSPLRKNNINNI